MPIAQEEAVLVRELNVDVIECGWSEMKTAPDTFKPVQEQTPPERTRTTTERPPFDPAREPEHDATRQLRGNA